MSVAPAVAVTADKAEYVQGDPVTLTFTVAADTRDTVVDRTVTWSGHDGEGNAVDGSLTTHVHVQVPDTFTLTSVSWEDTGVPFTVIGLQATGTA